MIEVVICPICGGKEFKEVLAAPFFRGEPEDFHIKECNACALWVTSPRPEDDALGKYYEQQNYVSHTDDSKSMFDVAYKVVRKHALKSKSDLVKSSSPKAKTVLDYGAGGGAFVNQLCTDGFDATGVEPSSIARENAKKQHGLNLLAPEDMNWEQSNYDVITLWHVLEHLPNLNNHLEQFRSALKPGGVLIVAVPNHESYDAKYYGKDWAALDVPLHLWHFKKSNINDLARKHGMALERVINMPFDSFYVSLLSEKVKGTGNPINAMWRGLLSNLRAGSNNASSLIYVLRMPA